MFMKLRHLALPLLAFAASAPMHAQDIAVKTNLVADALLSPNLGMEFGLAPKWSLDISGEFNGWTLSHNRNWRHWFAMPELRLWTCDRFQGHFFALHLMAGQYNIGGFNGHWNILGTDARKLKDSRFQGWFGGAGIAYGYAWPIADHWNIEAEVGIGWSYTRYDQFKCSGCGIKIDSDHPHNYVGPTKAAVNIVYIF